MYVIDIVSASPHQINLLNHFQCQVPVFWLRYNERVVEEMINGTFDLLLLGYNTPILLSPAHFLCLVDPLASWFRRWMVCGGVSRGRREGRRKRGKEGGREGGRERGRRVKCLPCKT